MRQDTETLQPATRARREAQRDRLVGAAERQIAANGLAGLKARELAAETGVALGAIYNLVADLDELVLLVIGRTLGRLDGELSAAREAEAASAPEAQLEAIARAYRRFACDNLNLWRCLFEHRPGGAMPEWAVSNQTRLFRHIQAPLAALRPEAGAPDLSGLSLTLFGAVHGVVALGLEGRVVGVPAGDLDGEVTRLVRLVAAGLRARGAQP